MWELTVVENAGEIPASKVTTEIAVETAPLNIDIKAQLMIAKPKTLVYTVGWRALVWQNKETGQFKDITEEEHDEYIRTGSINLSSSNGTDGSKTKSASGNKGSTEKRDTTSP